MFSFFSPVAKLSIRLGNWSVMKEQAASVWARVQISSTHIKGASACLYHFSARWAEMDPRSKLACLISHINVL